MLLILSLFCFLGGGGSYPQVGVWVALVRTGHAGVEQELRRLREKKLPSPKVKASMHPAQMGKERMCKDILMLERAGSEMVLVVYQEMIVQAWLKNNNNNNKKKNL